MERYQVAVLGAPDSGKTVYLATLNHLLGEARLAPGLAVTVRPAEVASRFEAIFQQIANPADDGFPAPTSMDNITEWHFECSVFARGKSFPLMTLAYFDAAGEWVRSPIFKSPQSKKFFRPREGTHAVLAFIDGEQVARFVCGKVDERTFMRENVPNSLRRAINECSGPVHIVVSKWDLLTDELTLAEVKGALLGTQDSWLRDIISDRNAGGGRGPLAPGRVRLIPVTSLGEFVYVGPDGFIHKKPDMEPMPKNVLVPLAAVLPDLCIRAVEAAARASAADFRPWWRTGSQEDQSLGMSVVAIAITIAEGLTIASGKLMRLILKGRMPMSVLFAHFRKPRLGAVKTQSAAFRYMMKSLVRYLRQFEIDHPDSRLT